MNQSLLIIDDLEGNRNALKRLFRPIFPEIAFAENGKEGLQKLKEQQFNIILLDLNMPIMGGIEFLEHFQENSKPLPCPVIICSGQDESTLR